MPKGKQGFQKGHGDLGGGGKKGEHRSPASEFKKGHKTWNKGRKGVQKSKWKGKTIPQLKKYAFQSGKLHWNWKGGICRDKHYLGKKKYRDWRLRVFKRDGFICQGCRKVGGALQVHHKS